VRRDWTPEEKRVSHEDKKKGFGLERQKNPVEIRSDQAIDIGAPSGFRGKGAGKKGIGGSCPERFNRSVGGDGAIPKANDPEANNLCSGGVDDHLGVRKSQNPKNIAGALGSHTCKKQYATTGGVHRNQFFDREEDLRVARLLCSGKEDFGGDSNSLHLPKKAEREGENPGSDSNCI